MKLISQILSTKRSMASLLFVLILSGGLAGCGEAESNIAKPQAIELTEEAAGFYCQMVILEHDGPKGQIHLAGMLAPIWFSQIRDGIAYIKSADQPAEILSFYVNDMGKAKSWTEPGAGNWIDAYDAIYVVGADVVGGMGAPEIVPFSNKADAEAFIAAKGGSIMSIEDIPIETVLAPVERAEPKEEG